MRTIISGRQVISTEVNTYYAKNNAKITGAGIQEERDRLRGSGWHFSRIIRGEGFLNPGIQYLFIRYSCLGIQLFRKRRPFAVVFTVATIWMLVTMVIAVRPDLDYKSTLRAVGVCEPGWVIQTAIIMVLFSLFGAAAPPAG
jgi:hypothetical protein